MTSMAHRGRLIRTSHVAGQTGGPQPPDLPLDNCPTGGLFYAIRITLAGRADELLDLITTESPPNPRLTRASAA